MRKLFFPLFISLACGGFAFSQGKSEIVIDDTPPPYEAGRGLVTAQGPSGMFINPTSATLPAKAFTAQYCAFFPDMDTSTVGHNWFASYGVTDWLEVGFLAKYVDAGVDPSAYGLLARVRLLKDEGWMPQFSVGYYGFYGNSLVESTTAFGAFYKRFGINEDGFLKSVGFHTGLRGTWADVDDAFLGYFGTEIQFPMRIYLVGEISTKDDIAGDKTPYSYGLQWRAGGINLSLAMLQNGGVSGGPGLFVGVGGKFQF